MPLALEKTATGFSGSGKKAKSAPQTNSTGSLRLLRPQPHSRRRKVIPDLNLQICSQESAESGFHSRNWAGSAYLLPNGTLLPRRPTGSTLETRSMVILQKYVKKISRILKSCWAAFHASLFPRPDYIRDFPIQEVLYFLILNAS